jgi:tetratricopeptide (TPR) repeat protein
MSSPPDPSSLLRRAQTLLSGNQRDAAAALCRRVWDAQPPELDTLCQLGKLFHQLGDPTTALLCFQRAAVRAPQTYAVQFGLGAALHELGRTAEALGHYDNALTLRPDDVDALNNRGTVLHALVRYDEALRSYDTALARRPAFAIAWYNRGNLLRRMARPDDALVSYDRALALQPDLMEAVNNRGIALQLLNRHAEALTAHEHALRLRPNDADALNNRAATLLALNLHDEASACYDTALEANPNLVEAHFNRSCCLLAQGDFAHGWTEHEWRWRLEGFQEAQRAFPQPRWKGEAVEGKTILLWSEQGLGDVLQFCRYVPMVAARAQVVLDVPRPLLRLMCSLQGGGQLLVPGQPPPRFDLQCPMMSLPLAFGTDLKTIPRAVPYLQASAADVAVWRKRLEGLKGLRVGLVWGGNPRASEATYRAVDQRRSCGLAALAPLGRVSGVDLVSLQKGVAAGQAQRPPPCMVLHDWTQHIGDFADTAALIETLDLVISVDTSVAHLAGALGKPVWVLNRFDACWRWLIDREDSPWYPTARLFRQTKPGDWSDVVARVVQALRAMADASHKPLPLCGRGRGAQRRG